MGSVIRFPGHVRTSARFAISGFRAAKEVSVSAEISASAARSVASTADHHSAGMLSRCHHFDTAHAPQPAPTSAAMASRDGQSSMIERNEVICSDMAGTIGQSVLKRKAILSLDSKMSLGHTVPMAESDEDAQYKQEFMERTRSARIASNRKQWQMAEALGIKQDQYKQYETRGMIPHRLIGRFCIITNVDPGWLLTGRGEKALKPLALATQEPSPKAKPRPVKRRKATRAA
jgi:hypothetical protein